MKKYRNTIRIVFRAFILLLLLSAVLATLFQHWEMTHESWAYWFFAEVFAQTGRLPIPDRSPVYVLYLQLFRGLGYPVMIDAEYIFTTFITTLLLVVFLRKHLGTFAATLGAILWIPYMQISEPQVQKLALVCGLLAVLVRGMKRGRLGKTLSYFFLYLANLFRGNYFIVLIIFIIWDLVVFVRTKGLKGVFSYRFSIKSDWPVVAGIVIWIIVSVLQSPHPWNNVYGATTTWFPTDAKGFNVHQNYNMSYIITTYGSYQDHDFYFTNQEVFRGARTNLGVFLANPPFIRFIIGEYVKVGIPMATNMTQLPKLFGVPESALLFHILLLVSIFLFAYLGVKDTPARLFIIGSFGMMVSAIAFFPKERFFFPLIPVFALAPAWFAEVIREITPFKLLKPLATTILISFMLLALSQGPTGTNFGGVMRVGWGDILRTVANDRKAGDLTTLSFRDTSIYFPPMKSSYPELRLLLKNCTGVMTLEHTFFGAFSGFRYDRIYDIWEIPPFGTYKTKGDKGDQGSSEYDGLTPERIDCLFISKNLKYGVGAATNSQIRYENYIQPYAQYLESIGAKKHQLNGYGEAIVSEK